MNRERIEETVRIWQAEPDKAKGKPTVIARAEESKAVMEHGSFSWRTDMPVLVFVAHRHACAAWRNQ